MTDEFKIKAVKGFAKLQVGAAYNIGNRSDYDDLIKVLKWLVSCGVRLELSQDDKVVTLTENTYRVEPIEAGFIEMVPGNKGILEEVRHVADKWGNYKPSYRIYRGDKLIAIEI